MSEIRPHFKDYNDREPIDEDEMLMRRIEVLEKNVVGG